MKKTLTEKLEIETSAGRSDCPAVYLYNRVLSQSQIRKVWPALAQEISAKERTYVSAQSDLTGLQWIATADGRLRGRNGKWMPVVVQAAFRSKFTLPPFYVEVLFENTEGVKGFDKEKAYAALDGDYDYDEPDDDDYGTYDTVEEAMAAPFKNVGLPKNPPRSRVTRKNHRLFVPNSEIERVRKSYSFTDESTDYGVYLYVNPKTMRLTKSQGSRVVDIVGITGQALNARIEYRTESRYQRFVTLAPASWRTTPINSVKRACKRCKREYSWIPERWIVETQNLFFICDACRDTIDKKVKGRGASSYETGWSWGLSGVQEQEILERFKKKARSEKKKTSKRARPKKKTPPKKKIPPRDPTKVAEKLSSEEIQFLEQFVKRDKKLFKKLAKLGLVDSDTNVATGFGVEVYNSMAEGPTDKDEELSVDLGRFGMLE